MHSAQGVTADTSHAVLGENTTRALLYVAMTRGRDTNTAYLHQRTAGEADHQHREDEGIHVARRGSSRDAAHLLRDIIAAHDERARSAHDVSATKGREHLSELNRSLAQRRAQAAERRQKDYVKWQEQTHTVTSGNERWRGHHVSRTSNPDHGIEL